MLVYSNWNKHRICDGIGGFSSITGTCTAASCFGWMNSSCLIFTAMLRRNLNFIMKNSWVGHTTSFAHLLVSTSWHMAVAETIETYSCFLNKCFSLTVFLLKLEQFSRLWCWLLQNRHEEDGGNCSSGGVAFVEKLLALLTLLPLLLLLVVLVNSFFLASLRASGENTGSVARDASCVTNLTTSWNIESLCSDFNILLARWHHLTPTLLGNFKVILLRVSSELRPSMYIRVFMACSLSTRKSANCWKCMPSPSLTGGQAFSLSL